MATLHIAFRTQKGTSVIIRGWKGGERGEGKWSLKRLNSLKWKERKGGKKRRERKNEREGGVRERERWGEYRGEIDGGVSGWNKEGDC